MEIVALADPKIVVSQQNDKVELNVYPLGAWNMDTTMTKNVNHSLDITKIIEIEVMIIEDGNIHTYNLSYTSVLLPVAGGTIIFTTNFNLMRYGGGFFDNAAFSNAVMNRGWITAWVLK